MAANDRDMVIKISAKNLTTAEFEKVQGLLKDLGQSADKTNKKTGLIAKGLDRLNKSGPTALKAVAGGAVAMAGAVAGAGVAIAALSERGTELGAVKESFVALTAAAGQSGDQIVKSTSAAAAGMVSDMDIMAQANKGLLLGLPITDDSMADLAKTAMVLGRAMKQDTTKSLDDLITALGRSSPMILDNLGLTVKVGEANEAYAKKLGISSDQLTDQGKKMAFYEAALTAARRKVAEIGDVHLTLADRLQQSRTFLTNLLDDFSIAVSQSPVFAAAVGTINDMLESAFSDEQGDRVTAVVKVLEQGAIGLTTFASVGVSAAQMLIQAWGGVKTLFNATAFAVASVAVNWAEMIATATELATALPGVGDKFQGIADTAAGVALQANAMRDSFREQTVEAANMAAGNSTAGQTLETMKTKIGEFRLALTEATTVQREANDVTNQGADAADRLAASTGTAVELFTTVPEPLKMMKDEMFSTGVQAAMLSDVIAASSAESSQAFEQENSDAQAWAAIQAALRARVAGAVERLGITTREQSAATEAQLTKDLETIVAEYGKYSEEAMKAEQALADFRKQTQEDSAKSGLSTHEAFSKGAGTIFSAMGGKFQAFAAAEASISALLASVKTMATTPWPANIPMAAAALAAGMAVVSKIKAAATPGFAVGTPSLDFQNFGTETNARLHGNEAVIPQGSGHLLAGEIAMGLRRRGMGGSSDEAIVTGMDRLGGKLDGIAVAVHRAVRDAMLLSAK